MTYSRVAPPYSWWVVEDLAFGRTGGPSLYYRLGTRRPIRDDFGRWRRDAQGRTALEAFGALPVDAMIRRLVDGDDAWRATGDEQARAAVLAADPERENRHWRAVFEELVSFVETFGPLGFDWPRTFPVDNRKADRALDDLDRRKIREVLQATRAPETASNRPFRDAREWQVTFRSPGFSMPTVSQIRTMPTEPWEERVRAGDDALFQDFIGPGSAGPLWNHQDDLGRAIALVVALSEPEPKPFVVKDALGRLPGHGRYDARDYGLRDPVGIDWRDAMRPVRTPRGGWWRPFKEPHPGQVDWVAAGRLGLAEYLSEQLAWIRTGVGLDDHNRFRSRATVGSILEIIYLQLLEHVEERLDFGIGACPHCAGPILRTRRSARTQNRAHRGCGLVLRKRRERARQRLRSGPEADS